jgi:hypothetical protein
MKRSLVVRVVIMVAVVAVIAIWLHLWWLAVLYTAFWGSMLAIGQRRARR